jgi:hypothetical protein
MFYNEKFVGLLGQLRFAQRYSPQIRDGEDRLIEDMVSLITKYSRYECRRIAALLQKEGLESVATNWDRSINFYIKFA